MSFSHQLLSQSLSGQDPPRDPRTAAGPSGAARAQPAGRPVPRPGPSGRHLRSRLLPQPEAGTDPFPPPPRPRREPRHPPVPPGPSTPSPDKPRLAASSGVPARSHFVRPAPRRAGAALTKRLCGAAPRNKEPTWRRWRWRWRHSQDDGYSLKTVA